MYGNLYNDNFSAYDLKPASEIEEEIKKEQADIKQINIDLAVNNEEGLLLAGELVPYDLKIKEINKMIEELYAQKRELNNQAYELKKKVETKKIEKGELNKKKEKKKTNIDYLKSELNKKKTQAEKDQKLREQGEALQARARDFFWYDKIKSYQLNGAKQAAVMGKVILGDEMGLGKSLTSIAAADLVGARKVLVISKRDIVANFEKEFKLWAPHRTNVFCSLHWKKSHTKTHIKHVLPVFQDFVVLLNFEALWNDDDLLADLINLQFDAVIIDEAHALKEENRKNFIGIKKLVDAINKCINCGHRHVKLGGVEVQGISTNWVCAECSHLQESDEAKSVKLLMPMTGSPILNRPDEIWPLLNLVDAKGFADKRSFLNAFCRQEEKPNLMGNMVLKWTFRYGGSSRLLKQVGPRFIRRTKEDVGLELPPQEITVHNVPFTEETHPLQYRAYRDLIEKYGAMFSGDDEYATVVAKQGASMVTRLRQVTSLPAGIAIKSKDPDTGKETIIFECDIRESAKLDAAFEDIIEKFEQGIRTVVFAKHTAVLEEMKKRLDNWREGERPIRSVIYSGGTALWQRESIQRDFDVKTYDPDNYRYDVIIAQLDAASQGLNFTAATHMCVIERPWGPKLEEQMLARTNRIGQTKENTVSIFQLEDTIDVDIEELIYSKKDDVEKFESSSELMQKIIGKIFASAKKGAMDAYE